MLENDAGRNPGSDEVKSLNNQVPTLGKKQE
jgi:hypothetical protein